MADQTLSAMNLRPAMASDVAALAELMAELGYPTSADEMAVRFAEIDARADFASFVAEEEGVIAGMICVTHTPSLYRSDRQGAITALVISPAFRGRGIAGLLVATGEQWLRDQGVHRTVVNPSTHRTDAHRLYPRLGYTATGTRFSKALD